MRHGRRLKVAVLTGGPSKEHEVSIKSAENVLAHLDQEKYETKRILIGKKGEWPIEPNQLKKEADVAFIAMHGPYGEDGTIQIILESEKIPYTGSGIGASALGMNKFLSLRLFKEAGLNIPKTFLIAKNEWQNEESKVLDFIRHHIGFPAVLKPNSDGSSFGVAFAHSFEEALFNLNNIFALSKEAIIQPYISGRELTCGVFDHGWRGSEIALLPTEIIPKKNYFFDYESKYVPDGASEITPPNLPQAFTSELRKVAIAAHRLAGARGFSRTDMILDKDGRIFILEINTIPGLTTESLFPKAAFASGVQFSKILDKIIESAFGR